MEEAAFLQGIADNPEDDTIRLVYADWLDERGDPRAEYIRLEHAVRATEDGDRSRLAAVRARLAPEWLLAMSDGLLGPDWAVVVQRGSPATALRAAGLDEKQTPKHSKQRGLPPALLTGLSYFEATRLRSRMASEVYVTVEYRPSRS